LPLPWSSLVKKSKKLFRVLVDQLKKLRVGLPELAKKGLEKLRVGLDDLSQLLKLWLIP